MAHQWFWRLFPSTTKDSYDVEIVPVRLAYSVYP